MGESKVKIETQFKLLDLTDRKIKKIIVEIAQVKLRNIQIM